MWLPVLQIPSPLVRVPQGTIVRATIRNTLASPLQLHGFCDRPGPCEPATIAAGASRDLTFALSAAGTFHYWATTSGSAIDDRGDVDSQLGGAIVVDPPGATVADRVFVIGIWKTPTKPGEEWAVINGRGWPNTERLSYAVGDSVHWRVINLSGAPHAMHLHGFYFRVDAA